MFLLGKIHIDNTILFRLTNATLLFALMISASIIKKFSANASLMLSFLILLWLTNSLSLLLSLAKRDPWLASFMKYFKTSYYGFLKNMFSYLRDILPPNGSRKQKNVSLLGCIRKYSTGIKLFYFLKF